MPVTPPPQVKSAIVKKPTATTPPPAGGSGPPKTPGAGQTYTAPSGTKMVTGPAYQPPAPKPQATAKGVTPPPKLNGIDPNAVSIGYGGGMVERQGDETWPAAFGRAGRSFTSQGQPVPQGMSDVWQQHYAGQPAPWTKMQQPPGGKPAGGLPGGFQLPSIDDIKTWATERYGGPQGGKQIGMDLASGGNAITNPLSTLGLAGLGGADLAFPKAQPAPTGGGAGGKGGTGAPGGGGGAGGPGGATKPPEQSWGGAWNALTSGDLGGAWGQTPTWGKWGLGIGGGLLLLMLLSKLFGSRGKQASLNDYTDDEIDQAQAVLDQMMGKVAFTSPGVQPAPRFSRRGRSTTPERKFSPGHRFQGSSNKKMKKMPAVRETGADKKIDQVVMGKSAFYQLTKHADTIDLDDKPGPLQGAYLADLAGMDAQLEANRQVLRSGEKGFFPGVAQLNANVLPMARRSAANQATNATTRWLSDLGLGGDINIVDLAASAGGGKDIREKVRQWYEQSGMKALEDRAPDEGPVTSRETPWHKMMQGQMADLDKDVAWHRWSRKNSPWNYWLNPFDKTGPLVETGDRLFRRSVAGGASPDSTFGRFMMNATPFASTIFGGQEAQDKLRRLAQRSGITDAGEGEPVEDEERATAIKNRQEEGEGEKPLKDRTKPRDGDGDGKVNEGKKKAAFYELCKYAVYVEEGGPVSRFTASTLGRVNPLSALGNLIMTPKSFSDPSRTLGMAKDPERMKKHQRSAEIMDQSDPSLQDTVLRLGGTNIVDDLLWKKERGESLPWYKQLGGRVWQNPKTSILGKAVGTLTTPVGNLMTTLMRGPHYNPYSDVAVNFWDDPSVTEHELGHALDFNRLYGLRPGEVGGEKRPDLVDVPGSKEKLKTLGRYLAGEGKGLARDAYMTAYQVPLVKLWHEAQANRQSSEALRKVLGTKSDEYQQAAIRRSEVLPAGYGSYVGGALAPAIGPAGPLAGMIGGKLYGLGQADELRERRDRRKSKQKAKDKKPRDGDGDGKVNEEESEKKKAASFAEKMAMKPVMMVRIRQRQIIGTSGKPKKKGSPSVKPSDNQTSSTTDMAKSKDRKGQFAVT